MNVVFYREISNDKINPKKHVVWDKLQLLIGKGNKAETNFKTSSTILLIFR